MTKIDPSQLKPGSAPLSPTTEIPQGAIDGVNTSFKLTVTPANGTQLVFLNGVCLFPAAGDYTITGNDITFTGTIPIPGDTLVVNYWH